MRDLYEVLGVERGASQADLKKAYRRLAQQYHPDKCGGDKDAEEKFKEAANAYQVLSDDEQRAMYDRYGFDGIKRGGGGGPGPGFSTVEDIFSAFGDLFGDFFGGRSSGKRTPRGADLRVDLELTFAEAVWGSTKDVKVTRAVACDTCAGTGAAAGSKPEVCRTCQGKGQVVHAQGFFMVQTTCPHCRGAGKTIKEPCEDCRGRGTKAETTTLSVTVPAGVDDGQTLRLAGKGESAPGGTAGHLYVVLHVQGDDRFRRDGDDVLSEVPISFVKAALGGEIEIHTLEDNCSGSATVELKPGTQPGDVIVRRGQGIPHVGEHGRGDHVIQFKVEIPKKLSARQEELMRELATELGEDGVRPEKRGLFGRKK
ncbi:MAG TPA: molecular chaperone DnaJ [Kofleriaceae bacterium]|nr:molecular chaperone DnaJ [Kofleriaceae bacterium]